MEKMIVCKICSKVIEDKEDLITAQLRMKVFPYHSECYANDLKDLRHNKQINGFSGNLSTIIYVLFGIGWFYLANPSIKFIGLIAIFPVFFRIYSFFAFERYLN